MCKEQWFLIPRGEISLLEIRSKIERQGVQREVRKSFSFLFVYLAYWSKIVQKNEVS